MFRRFVPALLLTALNACDSKAVSGSASAAKSGAATAQTSSGAAVVKGSSTPSAAASIPSAAADTKPLGKTGEGFASVEDALAAAMAALVNGDLTAFDVGRPTKTVLDTVFKCKEGTDLVATMDMKAALAVPENQAKGKAPFKGIKHQESESIPLKKGEVLADCEATTDMNVRVFGFVIQDADGKDAFPHGGVNVGLYSFGSPARIYFGPPK